MHEEKIYYVRYDDFKIPIINKCYNVYLDFF